MCMDVYEQGLQFMYIESRESETLSSLKQTELKMDSSALLTDVIISQQFTIISVTAMQIYIVAAAHVL